MNNVGSTQWYLAWKTWKMSPDECLFWSRALGAKKPQANRKETSPKSQRLAFISHTGIFMNNHPHEGRTTFSSKSWVSTTKKNAKRTEIPLDSTQAGRGTGLQYYNRIVIVFIQMRGWITLSLVDGVVPPVARLDGTLRKYLPLRCVFALVATPQVWAQSKLKQPSCSTVA